MADFINTVDVLGDYVVTGSIINRTVTEYLDNYVTKIGKYAFCQCVNLSKVDCPNVSEISDDAFNSCSSLTTASFPAATTIGSYAFTYCSSLTSVSFPVATSIGNSAFHGCSSLTSVSFPAATTIGSYAFAYCSSLTTASFPAATTIGSYAFARCTGLTTVILAGSSVCSMPYSNVFTSTPIASGTGYVYVPSLLVASYQAATNWSYFSAQISAIEDSEFGGV